MADNLSFKELIQQCDDFNGDLEIDYQSPAPTIEFSNSGRRGGRKFFLISLPSLLQTFIDVNDNLAEFTGHERYVEREWRDLFSDHLNDQATNAQSTVQTWPLFAVLSKIIHSVNGLDPRIYDEKVISLDSDHLEKVIDYLKTQIPDENLFFESLISTSERSSPAGEGENIIYYGAPGTGKSFAIDNVIDHENTVRTVFHADTQNADFIGSLKPSIDPDGDLTYAFQPGPFTIAYIMAVNNPDEHHWLVIEEINRAAAATVFGEIFQLLDRNPDGNGTYHVNISDPLWEQHMIEHIEDWSGQLKLPSNLSLLASMNSSDQSVMPMDTAFKRRWKFNYIPLDFDNACAQGNINVRAEGVDYAIEWKDFARTVNQLLTDNHIPEDRHLGPFFFNDEDLADAESALTGKLFMYLWDDVLRHGLRHVIFADAIKTYGQLIAHYQSGENIYSQDFLTMLDLQGDVEEQEIAGED